jgi:hypothetical protein
MGVLARDTEESAEKVRVEILKELPAWRKLELLEDACETTRALMLAGLRSRFPGASEEELHRKLMGLMVGEETAAKVWGRPLAAGQ